MHAMILAAGLGTRMRPLTNELAKPALPVRGRPVVSLLLELLARQGIREVMINLHHLPDTIRRAVEADHPAGLQVTWSDEDRPLGTGGGIRRAADFLSQSETCVVLAGDMLLDVDLRGLAERHRASGRDVTLLLRRDPREASFGSVGVDGDSRVCRVGRHPVARPLSASRAEARPASAAPPTTTSAGATASIERDRGLFTGVRFFQRDVFARWPREEAFEDLRDWLMPGAERGEVRLGAEFDEAGSSVWEPVGTPEEYLQVNLTPPDLPRLGGAAKFWQGDVELRGAAGDVVAARSVRIPGDARLARCVVWEGAVVPPGVRARDGVFGVRGFHSFAPADADQRGAA